MRPFCPPSRYRNLRGNSEMHESPSASSQIYLFRDHPSDAQTKLCHGSDKGDGTHTEVGSGAFFSYYILHELNHCPARSFFVRYSF
mmetsp:Transcript_12494/g.20221  ORF Transcript_12494/g.20221 Transcript_12494/m.20221 type:complete len:86 (-) Transcript_12494:498-755(-)